jgi:hypothetical protein
MKTDHLRQHVYIAPIGEGIEEEASISDDIAAARTRVISTTLSAECPASANDQFEATPCADKHKPSCKNSVYKDDGQHSSPGNTDRASSPPPARSSQENDKILMPPPKRKFIRLGHKRERTALEEGELEAKIKRIWSYVPRPERPRSKEEIAEHKRLVLERRGLHEDPNRPGWYVSNPS